MTASFLAPVILFGLLFMQLAFYFLGVPWERGVTTGFYLTTGLLTLGCAWVARGRMRFFNRIDACFLAFVLVSIVSLVASGLGDDIDYRILGFLVFLVFVPYVCGRCLRLSPELPKVQFIVSAAGLAIMPLLLIDRLMMPEVGGVRFPFFGMDHSPLAIGALLAATLIALSSWVLCPGESGRERSLAARGAGYVSIALTTVCLVWVSARGWLLAGLVAVGVITVVARRAVLVQRVVLLAVILLLALLSLKALPSVDPRFGTVYARMSVSTVNQNLAGGQLHVLDEAAPILGKASCQPFQQGIDSVAMRGILYQEAIAMFMLKPWFGVGAAAFGRYSCTGHGGFPHSTILHVLAELGLMGGGVFAALIALAACTLIQRAKNAKGEINSCVMTFVVALFVCVFIADQIYGNYFMMVATSLLAGLASSLRGGPISEEGADV